MKKAFSIIILVFTFAFSYSQSNFAKGYQKGFTEGYCYQNKQKGNTGCIEPIVPISPLSDISRGENETNYQDGYHRGFEDGKMNFLTQNTPQNNNPLYTPREYPKVYEPDLLALMGMVIQQRSAYQSYIDNIDRYYQNLQIQFLVNNQKMLEKVIGYYNSIEKSKLESVKLNDGWHEVAIIFDNKYEFTKSAIKEVDIAKGYLQDGKLTKLYRSNYLGYESKIPQEYPSKMEFKNGIIKLDKKYSNGFNQEIILMPLLQYLNPKYVGEPPISPAKIILWSSKKKLEGLEVEIDEMENNGWIKNIVKTKITYSKDEPTNCIYEVRPGKLELNLAEISYGQFAAPITDSKENKIYIDNNLRRVKIEPNQCLKIEYK